MPDEKQTLTCSVIINTYNRADYLRRLLPSLERQQDAVFEIIVVNGPSTDDTLRVLEPYRDRIKQAQCPKCNLSMSRNIGIALASGDLVLFMDDDALPFDTRWVARFAEAFRDRPQLAAAGGKVVVGDTEYVEYNGGLTTCFGFQHFDAAQTPPPSPDGEPWLLRVPGGNCAYRRSSLTALGGFDETFVYYADETDVCMRLVEQGAEITHLHDNPIRHYPQRIIADNRRLAEKYYIITRSDTYFALKNGRGTSRARLFKTIRYARSKHFYRDLMDFRAKKLFSRPEFLFAWRRWFTGFISGLYLGLFSPRKTAAFSSPPPFLAFAPRRPITQSRLLCIALLSQALPIQKDYGGIGRYMYDLALGLHERGHEVHLFYKDRTPCRHLSLGLTAHGIPPEEYEGSPLFPDRPVLNKNTTYSLAVLRRMKDLAESGIVFDVVHANNWDAESAAVIRKGKWPVVLQLVTSLAQDVIEQQWDWNSDMRLSIALDHWQITHANAVCSPTRGVQDSYRMLMGIPDSICRGIAILPLGIVPADAQPAPPCEPCKNILFAGRCERRKGIHTLLEALPAILEKHPDWSCDIVGNDRIPNERNSTYKQEFFEQYASAPWISRVHFHGFVTEKILQRMYRDCAIFAAPSLFESFGLIYLEAMQFAKPVIGCRAGGIPEVVADNDSGILIEPGNANQLRAALLRLIENADLRRDMGLHGQERVYRELNHLAMADRYADYYSKAIQSFASGNK